jgi:uncharacterized protein YkwD
MTKKKIKHILLRLFLSGVLSVGFLLITILFLKSTDGLAPKEIASVGDANVWRIVLIYGFLTATFTFITLWKKTFRLSAILLFVTWLLGTSFVILIKTQNSNKIEESNIGEFQKCYFDDTWIQVANDADCDQKINEFKAAQAEPTVNPSTKPAAALVAENNKPDSEDLWKVEKINEVTTDTQFPADSRMGTPEELFVAINNYRGAHNIPLVQKHDTLCRIAQTRANQLLELGELDQHAGMNSLAHSQQDFNNMGEVIGGGTQKQLAVHTVEWGWGRSLTGHRESILNPKWSHGCGGVAGLFNVFVLGNN